MGPPSLLSSEATVYESGLLLLAVGPLPLLVDA